MSTPLLSKKRVTELQSRVKAQKAALPTRGAAAIKLQSLLFPKQLAFVDDIADFATGCCSRRSGKSWGCCADLLYTALNNAETVSLYITLSRSNAKKLLWPILRKLNQELGVGGRENIADLSLTFPNKSVIYLSGASSASEIERFRGLPLIKVYVDEAQAFRSYLRELIDDVLAPALLDHAGKLRLIGTPGPVPSGYFYRACRSPEWAHHQWTFFDNPHIASKSKRSHRELLDRELKRRGVTTADPSIQREFFGEWVQDDSSLLFHFDSHKNEGPTPGTLTHYVMGVDIGYNDADAIAVIGWNDASPTAYLVEELVTAKQDISSLVEQIKRLKQRYDTGRVVMDCGALGKKIAEEMTARFGVYVEAADKARKMENVAFLNDALRTGFFKAFPGSRFAQDCMLVEVDREKSTPDRLVVSDRYHSDICDAVLYGFKVSPAYAYEAAAAKEPAFGSPAWYEQQAERIWEREREKLEQEANQDGLFPSGDWGGWPKG